ncbi:hypothetical protein GUJ93_ZPchr0010g9652 [Zizania palustris]|uniref:60S acidic ribosomal protein P2B n=1 Tax=Zizania palustris TaxID=103762 RepID=A0A8J6BCW4_ZIZPA|nr:hypothetical protein GUJ93_ZPchr0010g9652 [Zizania palustris]
MCGGGRWPPRRARGEKQPMARRRSPDSRSTRARAPGLPETATRAVVGGREPCGRGLACVTRLASRSTVILEWKAFDLNRTIRIRLAWECINLSRSISLYIKGALAASGETLLEHDPPLHRRRSRFCVSSRGGVSRLLTMKLIAAYLLAVLGGNPSPTADDIKNILESVGVEANEERLEFLLSELEGKDITEVIAAGREKFASVPSGGGAVAVAAPAAAAGGAAPAAESKKEEKVEEKEESDDDMGFSLFD